MKFSSTLTGFLAALAPGFVLFTDRVIAPGYDAELVRDYVWLVPASQWGSLASTVIAVIAAMAGRRRPRLARWFATLALVLMIAISVPWFMTSPLAALISMIFFTTMFAWVGNWIGIEERDHTRSAALRGAILATGLLWVTALALGATGILVVVALATSQAVAGAIQWRMAWHDGVRWSGQLLSAAGFFAPLILGPAFSVAPLFVLTLTFLLLVGLWFWRERARIQAESNEHLLWLELILVDPSRTLVATFLFGATVGGMLLALPAASVSRTPLPLLDALFTSFSAICVTGLIVVDTPTVFSGFGQLILLVIIQIGGLGIMTFSTAAITLLGRRMSLKHEATAAALLQTQDRNRLHVSLKRVLFVTFISESAGALVLSAAFLIGGDSVGTALWRGLFTSISAFCNAGFALQTDSLMPYQNGPFVLITVSVLIMVGGLGPLVVTELWRWRPGKNLSLASKIVLATTTLLLVVPAALILALEWNNTLAPLALVDRIANAWFQSVTLRTAGFNSIDLAAVMPATYSLMIVLMFIGGSPGSTAGGVKTTTVAALAMLLRAVVKGEDSARAFGFRIGVATIQRATAVAFMGFLAFLATLLILQLTQDIALRDIVFEVVSALGTVGLSLGATGELDEIGKVVVIVAMFAGRVGPLTLLMFLGRRRHVGAIVTQPSAEVEIG